MIHAVSLSPMAEARYGVLPYPEFRIKSWRQRRPSYGMDTAEA